jgi:hypothetical protein
VDVAMCSGSQKSSTLTPIFSKMARQFLFESFFPERPHIVLLTKKTIIAPVLKMTETQPYQNTLNAFWSNFVPLDFKWKYISRVALYSICRVQMGYFSTTLLRVFLGFSLSNTISKKIDFGEILCVLEQICTSWFQVKKYSWSQSISDI